MKITFHLSGGWRLDRHIEFSDGTVLQQSVAKGWYHLHVWHYFLSPKTVIEEGQALDALTRLYAESGIHLHRMDALDKLYEFDLRQIVWRTAAA